MSNATTYVWNVLKRSNSFRAACATWLTTIGGTYQAGQPIQPVVVSGGLAVLATVLTKCFDENMQTEKPTEPPKA